MYDVSWMFHNMLDFRSRPPVVNSFYDLRKQHETLLLKNKQKSGNKISPEDIYIYNPSTLVRENL